MTWMMVRKMIIKVFSTTKLGAVVFKTATGPRAPVLLR
jgi:hypothetical protein